MIALVAKLKVKEGKEQEFIDAMKDVVPAVRDQPRNRAYIMNRSKDDPSTFVFYEEYTDQAAVDEMRNQLNKIDMKGSVVIGEGEMDQAPMLFIGEKVFLWWVVIPKLFIAFKCSLVP